MTNAPTGLEKAKKVLNDKRKKLEAAHLVSVAAVISESNAKRDVLDALDLVDQEMEALASFAVSTAAAKVMGQAAVAAQVVKKAADVAGHSTALETLNEARELALKTLDDARIVALQTLAVAEQVALEFAVHQNAREVEMDLMNLHPPRAAPPIRS
jgi:hypothetical protein